MSLAVSILRASRDASGEDLLARLGIDSPRALIIIAGGAAGMSTEDYQRVTHLMGEGVARMAAQLGAVVVDGGTQSGVMQMMGEGRAAAGAAAPYIGVAPEGRVALPGGRAADDERVPLEPNHSHCVLVEGDSFGDETEVMYRLAAALSAQCPSVAVLVNGGQIATQEVWWNVQQNREVVILAGSGRLADALTSRRTVDRLAIEILRNGRLSFFYIDRPPAELAELLAEKLK